MPNRNSTTIAFDIDGILTLDWENDVFSKRTPNYSNIAICNAAFNAGNRVVLYTSRGENGRAATERWLHENGVKYNELIMESECYDIIIDSRSMTPEQLMISNSVILRDVQNWLVKGLQI
jgi:predicted SAM-dependent methyltransferase